MKKIAIIMTVLILAVSSAAIAGSGQTKAKLGPCVKQCVQAFNPSLADSGADEFLITDVSQQECVEICNADTTNGACYTFADGCCNTAYLTNDPDCDTLPGPGETCQPSIGCADGYTCQLNNPDHPEFGYACK